MAKVRNVSDSPLELRLDGFTASADLDEVIEVPDAIFSAHDFAESLWSVVTPSSKKKAEA
ncbi:MAG: hypothetical protein ACXV5Q_01370 [Frankiaceae bacterium]